MPQAGARLQALSVAGGRGLAPVPATGDLERPDARCDAGTPSDNGWLPSPELAGAPDGESGAPEGDLRRPAKIVPIRLAAAALAAVLILVVAVTPLEAIIRPGHFELSVPASSIAGPRVDASLDDQTGFVSALALADANPGLTASSRVLIVPWEGDSCGSVVSMQFSTSDDRYRLAQQTARQPCSMGIGLSLRFALLLRAPIDPTQVEVTTAQ